jgi:hypothetical protein
VAATILGLLIGIAGLIVAVVQLLPPDPPDGPPETTGKPPPKPGQVPNGRIVFFDDFGAASSAWQWGEDDDTEILHEPGEMRIIIKKGPLFQWNRVESHGHALRLEDARVDVGVSSLDEPHAYAGILCRYTGRDDYYEFDVTSDGAYVIRKRRAGRWRILVPRTPAPELKRDQLRIQVACLGGPGSEPVRLMLWAGGKGLARYSDTQQPLPPGEVAIGAGTYGENDRAEVAFTRFALHQITG